VLWDIDLKFGGTDGEIDYRLLKWKSLSWTVVREYQAYIGRQTPFNKVDIDAGAANFKIFVPKNSGIKVEVDGLLSSVSFKDLTLNRLKENLCFAGI